MIKFLNRETVTYLIVGILTTLVNVGIYQVLIYFGVVYYISNIFALVIGKLFAYVMNKLVVFRCFNRTWHEFICEFGRFVIARGATGLIDYFGVIIAVSLLGFDEILSKYFFVVAVIILNYFLGKRFVFRNKHDEEG